MSNFVRSPPAERTNSSSQPIATPSSLSAYKMRLKDDGDKPCLVTNNDVDFTQKVLETIESEEVRPDFHHMFWWSRLELTTI